MHDAPLQSTKVEKKSMSRGQSSKLLNQMESVVGSQKVILFSYSLFSYYCDVPQFSGASVNDESSPGYVVITIHKALDIEKKGMVGKADPYVVLQVDNLITCFYLEYANVNVSVS